MKITTPIISRDRCDDMYSSMFGNDRIDESMICAGFEKGGKDSC